MTQDRVELFDRIIENRTRYLTVILEDIFQTQNASAVIRTCDCCGIQDLHIIEKRNKFRVNVDVALGSTQWVSLNKYTKVDNSSFEVFDRLKSEGYRIVATSPHADGVDLPDFDLGKGKVALLFGTERQGLTKEALSKADEFLKIPMVGFTESYNISVSVAIILYQLTNLLRNSDINWKLTSEEKQEIKLQWMKTSIRSSDLLEKEFFKNVASLLKENVLAKQ